MADGQNLLATFKQQMGADKKKTVFLFVLVVVFLVVMVRTFSGGGSPASAKAAAGPAAKPRPKTPDKQNVITPIVINQDNQRNTPKESGEVAAVHLEPVSGERISVDGLPRAPERDIFSTNAWDRFQLDQPPPLQNESAEADEPSGPSFFDLLRQGIEARREAKRRAVEAFNQDIAALQLQSTMTGSARSAYISGRLVHEGDEIQGFSVVRIDDRQVILEKSGVRGPLKMP